MTHPRVLFITPAAFNRVTGGGITFTNLFRGWPKDAIATVHTDTVPVSDEVCDRYYRLTENEISTWRVLARLRGQSGVGGQGSAGSSNSAGGRRLMRRVKGWIFGDGLPETGRLSPELEAWISDFKPDLIYTPLGTNGMMDVIRAVRDRFTLPVVTHFMDDWQSVIYRGGILSWMQRFRMQRIMGDLVRKSALRIGICDTMSEIYAQRFGGPFVSFQNTVDAARWASSPGPRPAGRPVRLLYTGSILSFAQLDSLIDCCRAVVTLRGQGLEVRLDIYSPLFQTAGLEDFLLIDPAIQLQDSIADDEIYFRTLREADVLLLPVNFDAHSVAYIGLSMPTKVPSYLVSGTPVLVYGPGGTAQVDYARRGGWGHVVDRRDGDALVAGLRQIIADDALRDGLSRRALRLADERHDAGTVRVEFQAALTAAARKNGIE